MSGMIFARTIRRGGLVLTLGALLTANAAWGEPSSWTRWGGPTQDFRAPAEGIASAWPADGPERLWSRKLGDGYSTVLVESGRLYTMYRIDEQEAVIALDAKTGKTVWERRYDHDPDANHVAQFGTGPRATPLISGDRIYTIGVAGRMHCLDKVDGKVHWSHDLWGEEFGGNVLPHGYASSPIEYGDTVIALVGGEGKGIVAFDKGDGSVVWQSLDFGNSYSTPQIMKVDGEEQLVTFMAKHLIGVDPKDGGLLWSYPVENQWDQNISPPILVDGQYLFMSSLQVGARGLKLAHNEAGGTDVEELWSTRKVQFYHVTSVEEGDYVYGSSGGRAPNFMSAINAKTGEIAWRKRGFAKANTVYADDRLIVLDEDGHLYLTTATPEDLTVHSEVPLLEAVAWTAPTIVGKTMYVRDKVNITALDLSTQASAEEIAMAQADAPREETTAAAVAPVAATPATVDPNEPEAVRILRKVDSATKAVTSAHYKVTTKPSGAATQFVPATEGEAIMVGWTGSMPERFWGRVKAVAPGSEEPVELTGGGDGEMFFLLDHNTKKAYSDMDPNVFGTGGQALGAVRMIEFVHDTPFDDEINADTIELQGSEEVGGVPCHKIRVVYSGGQGESIWFFSKEDFLPRRRIRVFNDPRRGEGSVEVTITELEIDPKIAPERFALRLPEGYERVDDFAP